MMRDRSDTDSLAITQTSWPRCWGPQAVDHARRSRSWERAGLIEPSRRNHNPRSAGSQEGVVRMHQLVRDRIASTFQDYPLKLSPPWRPPRLETYFANARFWPEANAWTCSARQLTGEFADVMCSL